MVGRLSIAAGAGRIESWLTTSLPHPGQEAFEAYHVGLVAMIAMTGAALSCIHPVKEPVSSG